MTLGELVQREEMAETLRTWWKDADGFNVTPDFIGERIENFYKLYDQLIEENADEE